MIDFIDLKYQQSLIEDELMKRIGKVLGDVSFIKGEEVRELEQQLERFTGASHCIAVGNGTDALQIALMALGVGPGDEVIVPAFSFIATAEAVAILGAKPVYVDVDKYNFNLNSDLVESVVSEKAKAIIAVSLFGQCADFDSINEVAGKYDLAVIEDGAQSFGARYKGKNSCNLSSIATTSFFPSKPLGCYGDGGAIFTSDEEMAKYMRSIANHGQEKRYHHTRVGVNSRLDTLQAAVLLAKLSIFDKEVVHRKEAGAYYTQLLKDRAEIVTPHIEGYSDSVFAQYTIQVERRDRIRSRLNELGVPTAIHYPLPLNKQPAIEDKDSRVPVSEYLSSHVISLPMHGHINKDVQESVVEQLLSAVNE
ncbi:MAG: DegT/DnrJ/EryC1/StrS family aminotransferase [Endozoicomonas sp.]